jgi:tellurite resistance protein
MIGAQTAGTLGHKDLGWLCLGLGLVGWVMLGSVILHRLMFGPRLPTPLAATMAIEIAPPAVASTAYLTLNGNRVDPLLLGLGGFCLLMVLAQVHLLPIYRKVPFFPNYWAFTFSWAAVIGLAIRWLALEHPAGQRTYAVILTCAISVFIGAVALGSIVALARRVARPPTRQSAVP